AFLHSHSYTGNALACRAALATLEIFSQDNVIVQNRELADYMTQATAHFHEHPHVAEVRQTGMILAIELVKHKQSREPYAWQERRGLKVYQHGLKHGVLLRPLGNVVYFMPPYIISKDEIDKMVRVAWEGILKAVAD
ncbi:Adenosylmethionine-8-amino-7-oxononanoate aminotransferase, partial [hydrothermal vent metagenome]